MENGNNGNNLDANLQRITIRIRRDQVSRLEIEQRARGETFADVLRDNLDLAFSVKEEMAKAIQGQYDAKDPQNAPRLVHSLLRGVEERILAGLDNLARLFEKHFTGVKGGQQQSDINHLLDEENYRYEPAPLAHREVIDEFLNMITDSNDYPVAPLIGAFLEVVSRMKLVSSGNCPSAPRFPV